MTDLFAVTQTLWTKFSHVSPEQWLSILDLGLLLWIALMERASLKLDKLNHQLYRDFFSERTRWYQARGKKKPSEVLPTEGGDVLTEAVAETLTDSE